MNMKKKLVAGGLVAALAATAIGGATLAYFTDEEKAVNTFSVGNVDITLTESEWVESDAKLIPGRVIDKNPTITLEAGSEDAYTFMKVQLSQDFVDLLTDYATAASITNPMDVVEDWFVSEVGPKVMYVDVDAGYAILGVMSPKSAGDSVTYFDRVTVPEGVTQDMIDAEDEYTITVTGYAIQEEGFDTREEAFAALFPELA